VFVPGKLSKPSLMFVGNVQNLKVISLGSITLGWKDLPGTNTSLLQTFANYGRREFYNIEPWLLARFLRLDHLEALLRL
jgi:hypothetical protein